MMIKLSLSNFSLGITLLYVMGIIIYVSKKIGKPLETIEEFFSVGEISNEKDAFKKLERTFEATNISFTTAFLGIFYLSIVNVFYSCYFILGYILGIIIFANIFLKKMYKYVIENKYYPEILGEKTASKYIRTITSILILLSLLMFYFTEIYGFSTGFLAGEAGIGSFNSFFIAFVLLILLAWYIIIGGYRNVILTDNIQAIIIRIGFVCLLILLIIGFYQAKIGYIDIKNIIINDAKSLNHLIFLPCLVIGFMFSQIMYYDNWQRLILFNKSFKELKIDANSIVSKIRSKYNQASYILSFIYIVPVLFAIYAKANGLNTFNAVANSIWQDNLIMGFIFLISILTFISALLSTVDSYIIGFLQVIHNDITKLKLADCRKIIVLISFLITPFILFKIDLGKWFTFLFYAFNGLTGPLVLVIMGLSLRKTVVFITIVISFLFISLVYFKNYPVSNDYIDIANAFVIVFSFAINYAFARRLKNA